MIKPTAYVTSYIKIIFIKIYWPLLFVKLSFWNYKTLQMI